MSENGQSSNVGRIVEIKGVVIDAVFSSGLPAIYNALEISLPDGGRLVARRCSSTWATAGCGRSRWTRPTAWPAAST